MKLKPLTVIGLNSGTSMDGIDAALFRISPSAANGSEPADYIDRPKLSIEMLESLLYEFEPALKHKLKTLLSAGEAPLEEICRLDAALGEEFARAALKLMRRCSRVITVDLIGSHGQTIYHAPRTKLFAGVSCSSTMQLGDTAIIAERTGIPVMGDFRAQDMAAGGQGAPLLAFADEVLFGEQGAGTGILNIGGIANLTALDAYDGRAIMAFDTGPGNMLADRVCEKLFQRNYDDGGAIALSGRIETGWLVEMLALPYFDLAPPKTTGRELFGYNFADALVEHGLAHKMSKESILATITALTPASIAQQYKRFVKESVTIEKIVLGGGGAENKFICKKLLEFWPHELQTLTHEDFGISTKFKEALLFALLAYTSYFRIPNNVPACTGASRRVCLGKLCRP